MLRPALDRSVNGALKTLPSIGVKLTQLGFGRLFLNVLLRFRRLTYHGFHSKKRFLNQSTTLIS
jgi:hypothetical protein